MSNEPSKDRRYTEKEIQAILKRASDLQTGMTENAATSSGTTLAQLQQAATEIGIDADLIARAAQSLNSGEDADENSLLAGRPWKVDFDQIVPGVVNDENWAYVVDEMRAATGRGGVPKAVGERLEWVSGNPDPLHVTFTPAGDNTRVRVTARFGDWGVAFYVAPAFLALLVAAVASATLRNSGHLTPELLLLWCAGLPGVTLLGSRMAFKRFCAKRRQQTYQFINRLKQVVTQSSPQNIAAATPETLEVASTRPSVSTQPSTSLEEPLLNVQRLQS